MAIGRQVSHSTYVLKMPHYRGTETDRYFHFIKVLVALTVSMVTFLDGLLRGFATVALPHLELTVDEGSTFAAMSFMGGIVLTPLGGSISGWLGRKKTLMVLSPIASMGWILIAASSSKLALFFGRMLSSVATYAMLATPSNNT